VTARTESTRPALDIRKDEGTEYDAIHSHPEPTRPGALALEMISWNVERNESIPVNAAEEIEDDLRALLARCEAAEKEVAGLTHERDVARTACENVTRFRDGWQEKAESVTAAANSLAVELIAHKAHAAALAGAIEHAANVLDEPVDEATAERLQISLRRTLSENGGGK